MHPRQHAHQDTAPSRALALGLAALAVAGALAAFVGALA